MYLRMEAGKARPPPTILQVSGKLNLSYPPIHSPTPSYARRQPSQRLHHSQFSELLAFKTNQKELSYDQEKKRKQQNYSHQQPYHHKFYQQQKMEDNLQKGMTKKEIISRVNKMEKTLTENINSINHESLFNLCETKECLYFQQEVQNQCLSQQMEKMIEENQRWKALMKQELQKEREELEKEKQEFRELREEMIKQLNREMREVMETMLEEEQDRAEMKWFQTSLALNKMLQNIKKEQKLLKQQFIETKQTLMETIRAQAKKWICLIYYLQNDKQQNKYQQRVDQFEGQLVVLTNKVDEFQHLFQVPHNERKVKVEQFVDTRTCKQKNKGQFVMNKMVRNRDVFDKKAEAQKWTTPYVKNYRIQGNNLTLLKEKAKGKPHLQSQMVLLDLLISKEVFNFRVHINCTKQRAIVVGVTDRGTEKLKGWANAENSIYYSGYDAAKDKIVEQKLKTKHFLL